MKRTAASLLLLVLVAACAAPSPAPDREAMVAAANALDARFVAAFNAGDAQTLTGLYWKSPETMLFAPDVLMMRGIDGIRAGMDETLAEMKGSGATLELTESHQVVIGDVVLGWGLWKMTTKAPDGAPMVIVGRYTDAKAERDGTWVYLIDHASVPLPPPPADGGS